MDFRQTALVICALCVFGGILANAGMIVLLVVTSRRKKGRHVAAQSHPASDAPAALRRVQYAPTSKDVG
jgi:hypothetical protein